MTAGGQHNSIQQLSNKQPFITLSIIAIVLAGVSVNFFIIGSLGIVPFIEYKDKILIPSVIVLAAIAIYSHFKIKPLSNRLLTGLWAGTLATLALEAVRIPSFMILHWLPGDDMIMMPGALLTGLAPSPMALMHMMQSGDMASMPYSIIMTVMTAGVIYHFWNGATLGAIYTVFIGRTRWYYGLIWGFIIHIGMMLAPWLIMMVGPFGLNYDGGFSIFTASFLAHMAYGTVLGVLASKFVKDNSGSIIKVLRR